MFQCTVQCTEDIRSLRAVMLGIYFLQHYLMTLFSPHSSHVKSTTYSKDPRSNPGYILRINRLLFCGRPRLLEIRLFGLGGKNYICRVFNFVVSIIFKLIHIMISCLATNAPKSGP